MQDNQPTCWIKTLSPEETSPELRQMYRQLAAVHKEIHNFYLAFSLQPKPLLAADQHFRDILHNEANHSEPWFLELLATQVAIIADCHYASTNHGANFKFLLGDEELGEKMIQAVREEAFAGNPLFTPKHAALLAFGAKLSRYPEKMNYDDIMSLRRANISDTEILEAVQATACFAYWARFINALGINRGNEPIGWAGYRPSSDD